MAPHAPDRKWLALALLAVSAFMIVVDVSIVNVALPSIKTHLHFSESSLQWVISAYTLTFGGFLLLGGRAADLLGRRKLFMVGMGLFTVASLWCGLSGSAGMLIAARAVQGLGAAIVSPAALSILSTTFEEGKERNTALGVWGAVSGAGAAVGVLAGGVLTSYLGWEWIFFVNVPIGAVATALAPFLLRESRADLGHKRFDAAGALAVTSGLSLLVYAVVTTDKHHWGSATTAVLLLVAAALLGTFLVIEARSTAPLMPLRFFRNIPVAGANIVGFLLGTSVFAMFFFLSLYMQQVLHYSALKSGIAYLAIAGSTVPLAGIAQALVTRFGARPIMAIGMLSNTAALAWFTQVRVDGSYARDLLPGFLIGAVGLAFSFVPIAIAALAGVEARDAGLASGLLNTSQQIGGAVGIAVLATIAANQTSSVSNAGIRFPVALTSGFHHAFAAGAAVAFAGALVTIFMVRSAAVEPEAEIEAAAAS
jgi:EmrB/QacA subfamily drug resistance transporter